MATHHAPTPPTSDTPSPPPAPPGRALLAIIGGGTMAQAIIRGAFDAKLLSPFEIVACDPDPAKRKLLSTWGVQAFATINQTLAMLASIDPTDERTRDGQIMLAVKPQSLMDVASILAPLIKARPRTVISMLAGTPTAKLRAVLDAPTLPVVRVMPNTPAQLRKSMTALCRAENTPPEASELAHDLFVSLGEVVTIREELMDAFTAIAGSGPAYVFHLAEAMLQAAEELGFDRITADRIVRQTVLGSAMLLDSSHETPAALRESVTSKAGVTAAALAVMSAGSNPGESLRDCIARAIAAGKDRGVELGQ